jgi:energy-coupling factor transporter ATP-binding protein EcfA2
MFNFQPAVKSQSKLRLALFGPSGSGKTYTALELATGITRVTNGKIALIDTERSSASLYADTFTFDTLNLPDHRVETYVGAIQAAEQAGYGVLVIDSLSHGWQELLQEIDRLAKAKYRGNTWSAWSEGTPLQKKMVNALLQYDGHIIATMRTKTEWLVETDGKGKGRPIRVGLQPEQGKGVEYEFTMLGEISPDHIINFIKDRTGKYQDKLIETPGADLGQEIAEWLMSGKAIVEPPKQEKPKPTPEPKQPTIARPAGVTDDKLWTRYASLVEQAMDLDLQVDPLPEDTTNEALIEKGVALKEVIELAKETE